MPWYALTGYGWGMESQARRTRSTYRHLGLLALSAFIVRVALLELLACQVEPGSVIFLENECGDSWACTERVHGQSITFVRPALHYLAGCASFLNIFGTC